MSTGRESPVRHPAMRCEARRFIRLKAAAILRSFLPHPVVPPPGIYTAHGANWAARGRPVSRPSGVYVTDPRTIRAPDRAAATGNDPGRLTLGIVRIGSHAHYPHYPTVPGDTPVPG